MHSTVYSLSTVTVESLLLNFIKENIAHISFVSGPGDNGFGNLGLERMRDIWSISEEMWKEVHGGLGMRVTESGLAVGELTQNLVV